MLYESIESKELSSSVLVKLARLHGNYGIVATSVMFSGMMRPFITIKCCEILERLASNDDVIDFFVDRKGKNLEPKRLEALVWFLENDDNDDVHMAAAGLLANLPKSEREFNMKLIDLGSLDAIISILINGIIEAKESAPSVWWEGLAFKREIVKEFVVGWMKMRIHE
ncbi:unnamed protein product [Sphenostylis stenocarpa]|uniref:Uncharacterized protein n=1 Tax=Sphenostylis stenocarpa TaxID=92480 RepID=A0AA86SUH4_9FABA|nr:unnamed protein product [Sphenostylis stenocarpa]